MFDEGAVEMAISLFLMAGSKSGVNGYSKAATVKGCY